MRVMKSVRIPVLLLFTLAFCTCAPPPTKAFVDEAPPELTNLPGERLAEIKRAYLAGSSPETAVVKKLIERADKELDGPIYTIVHKEIVPPSGSKNDYMTVGPYWWPDPEQEDGLPWIRRDGEVNPVARGALADRNVARDFVNALNTMSHAAYFTGQEKYAGRADELMRAWFLDPATRMNPHLEYAQGVPGRSEGRCFGIIEWTMVGDIVTDLELLNQYGQVPQSTIAAADQWIADYLNWLQTSELGIEEGERHNNHGTWYDVQLMTMMLYLDREDEARRVAENAKARIDSQIASDGSQPHELERTKSLSYSTMNLRAFTELAYLSRKVDVDLWGYRSPTGAGIPTAYSFLEPYATGEEVWKFPQLGDVGDEAKKLRRLFQLAGGLFSEREYCALAGKVEELDDLVYACR